MYVTGIMAVVCWEKEQKHTQKKKNNWLHFLAWFSTIRVTAWFKKKPKTKSFVADTGSSLGHSRDKKDGGSQKQKLEPASLNETIN